MSHFGIWEIAYLGLAGFGLLCAAFATVTLLIRRSHSLQLPGFRLDVSATDAEDGLLPANGFYLRPRSHLAPETTDGHRPQVTAVKSIAVVGGGLLTGALFGLLAGTMLAWTPLNRLVGAAAVGLGAAALISFALGLGRVSRPMTASLVDSVRGARGEVTIPIPLDSFGQVTVWINGKRLIFSARTQDLAGLPRGAAIEVLDLSGDLAVVRSIVRQNASPPS